MITNPQRPFSYLPPLLRPKSIRTLNSKWDYLPSNYAGICTWCLRTYQKVPKDAKCTHCEKIQGANQYVRAFTKELLPWRLLPANLSLYPENYLINDTPFRCLVCTWRYNSLAVFSSLCFHKEHHVRRGVFVCRFCCKTVSSKVMKAIDDANARKLVISSPASQDEDEGEDEY